MDRCVAVFRCVDRCVAVFRCGQVWDRTVKVSGQVCGPVYRYVGKCEVEMCQQVCCSA